MRRSAATKSTCWRIPSPMRSRRSTRWTSSKTEHHPHGSAEDPGRFFESGSGIDQAARQKIDTQKRTILEGSQEWDILYRKYYNEEVKKLGYSFSSPAVPVSEDNAVVTAMKDVKSIVKRAAVEAGFDLSGVAPATGARELEYFPQWICRGSRRGNEVHGGPRRTGRAQAGIAGGCAVGAKRDCLRDQLQRESALFDGGEESVARVDLPLCMGP